MAMPPLALKCYVPGVPMMATRAQEFGGESFELGDLVPVEALGLSVHRINTLMEMRLLKHTDEKFLALRDFTFGDHDYTRGQVIREEDLKADIDQQLNLIRARLMAYAPDEMLKAVDKAAEKVVTKKKPTKAKKTE